MVPTITEKIVVEMDKIPVAAKTKSMVPKITETIVIEMDKIPVAANPTMVEMLLIIVAKIKPMMI